MKNRHRTSASTQHDEWWKATSTELSPLAPSTTALRYHSAAASFHRESYRNQQLRRIGKQLEDGASTSTSQPPWHQFCYSSLYLYTYQCYPPPLQPFNYQVHPRVSPPIVRFAIRVIDTNIINIVEHHHDLNQEDDSSQQQLHVSASTFDTDEKSHHGNVSLINTNEIEVSLSQQPPTTSKTTSSIQNQPSHKLTIPEMGGKVWCRVYLTLVDSYPEIAGDVERLKNKKSLLGDGGGENQACMYVANHASFLDIAVLCCVLDPVFKFIAKDSLKKFPGVGKQLRGGEHVLIDRSNKRSQLRTFKQAITYLQNGVSVMAFPEGARSPDGRLMDFKPGLFSMATKANVPIVPLSIANTHAVMPTVGFLPVQRGKGKLRVYVHEPIEVEGKSEEAIAREVREVLLSELPLDQHPLEYGEEEI
eukprot:scaffold13332_cov275-Alexandrium_tamarense.AAC.3